MRVIDFLTMMVDYQKVTITPCSDLEWNADNPYVIQPVKVRDLTWHFVRDIGDREVVEVRTAIHSDELDERSYLSIDYR